MLGTSVGFLEDRACLHCGVVAAGRELLREKFRATLDSRLVGGFAHEVTVPTRAADESWGSARSNLRVLLREEP